MAKEDATGQAVESSMEQLLDINRKQSEIISAQARTIEELRGTIVELNASLAWLKRKVFGKMRYSSLSITETRSSLLTMATWNR